MQNIRSTACILGIWLASQAMANDPASLQPITPINQNTSANTQAMQMGMAASVPPMANSAPTNAGTVAPTAVQPEVQQLQQTQQLQQLQQIQQLQQMQMQQQNTMMPAANTQTYPPAQNSYPETAMMTSAPVANPAPANSFGSVNDPAFQNVLKKQFPLTPDQIMRLRETMQETQRATAAPLEPPTPTVSSQTVSLSPGTIPPVIRLATGYVSSIVFVDETGAPWPIVGYSIGNPTAFNIQWDQKGNVLMMQGVGAYQTGNLAVQLQGLSMPVMVTIVNDQKVVDYRIDLRLQGRGPHASAPLIGASIPAGASAVLLNLLDGVPPQGSEALSIVGGDAKAWNYNNMIYLRTRLTVLSPAWNSTMTSPDGMRVYEMNTTPVILASDQGQTVSLKVEGL